MSQFKNVLLATDFSDCARHAREYAFALTKAFGGTLHAVHVIDEAHLAHWGPYSSGADVLLAAVRQHAEDDLADILKMARTHEVEAETHLLTDKPATAIVKLAEDIDADLIVIGTHGHSPLNRLVSGGTCDKVVRLSKIPVLSIKQAEHEFIEGSEHVVLKRVLFPCDFSDFSMSALPYAASLCREFGATLVLVHVFDTRHDYPRLLPGVHADNHTHLHHGAVERLKEVASELDGVECQIEVAMGKPDHEVIEAVEEMDIDLVVLATHGRTGLSHALLGSVTDKVIRLAHCPVLTARPARHAPAPEREAETAGAQGN